MTDASAIATQTRVTLVVPVRPGRIFDLLATPHRLPEIDPAGTIVSDDNASLITAVGQRFTMNMAANGGPEPIRYQAQHHVDAFEHNRVMCWTVTPTTTPSTSRPAWPASRSRPGSRTRAPR